MAFFVPKKNIYDADRLLWASTKINMTCSGGKTFIVSMNKCPLSAHALTSIFSSKCTCT